MLVQINYFCHDEFGTWQSESAGFANNDNDAIIWANEELNYLKFRFPDIIFSDVKLIQPDLSFDCLAGDRFISMIGDLFYNSK